MAPFTEFLEQKCISHLLSLVKSVTPSPGLFSNPVGVTIASAREAVAARTLAAAFRYLAFWLLKICGTTVNIRNTCCASLPDECFV